MNIEKILKVAIGFEKICQSNVRISKSDIQGTFVTKFKKYIFIPQSMSVQNSTDRQNIPATEGNIWGPSVIFQFKDPSGTSNKNYKSDIDQIFSKYESVLHMTDSRPENEFIVTVTLQFKPGVEII